MRRRCAGTSMRLELSNNTLSSSAIRPRSGGTRPAIMLTSDVLPEPDGPNSAVAPPAASNLIASANSPSFFCTSTLSISFPVVAQACAPGEPFRGDQCDQRQYDGDHHEPHRLQVAAGHLRERVDRRRQRLRLTGDVGN